MKGNSEGTARRLEDDLPPGHRRRTPPSVLIVEDERNLASVLRIGLRQEGYHVEVAATGPACLERYAERPADLVVLDLMLPGIDGVEVCRRLRAHADVLILMLTARDGLDERLAGFEAGADDYMVKPFDFEELVVRIRALLRRRGHEVDTTLEAGPFTLDERELLVTVDGRHVGLSQREYDLFRLFMRHRRQVLSRASILDHVWGPQYFGDGNIVDVYVGTLRRKVDPERRYLLSVRGLGYRFMA